MVEVLRVFLNDFSTLNFLAFIFCSQKASTGPQNIVCMPRHFKYLINFVKISFRMLIFHVFTLNTTWLLFHLHIEIDWSHS